MPPSGPPLSSRHGVRRNCQTAGKERRRLIRNAHEGRDAALRTHVERFRPMCAAVARDVDTAIGVVGRDAPEHADRHDAAIARVDRNARDVSGAIETRMLPVFSTVSRMIDAVARLDVVARIRFARSDPDVAIVSAARLRSHQSARPARRRRPDSRRLRRRSS